MAKINNTRSTFDVDLLKVDLSVHPEAESAFLYSKEINDQYDLDTMSSELIQLAQRMNPLIVIPQNAEAPSNAYLFVSGWFWLDKIERAGLKKIHVLRLDDLAEKDISLMAWMYLASKELEGIDRRENFSRLKHFLSRVESKKVTFRYIELVSGESRAVIRGQTKKRPKPISRIEKYMNDNGQSD